MEMEKEIRNCKQKQCPVGKSGKCLEGLEPEACSHFYWETVEDDIEIKNEVFIKSAESPLIKLFDGKELTLDTIGIVTNRFNTSLVIIIGDSNSGKTTILTSLYDMFQTGEFKELFFAGSLTQVGFETRCHLSRSASKTKIAETLKTTSKDFNFLHISYKNVNNLNEAANHILLSDISGERFALANVSSSVMAEMELMKEADHLVYLLDGEKLSNKFEKNAALFQATQFITRALDNNIFNSDTELHVIFSKGDILHSLQNPVVVEVIKEFNYRFNERLSNLKFSMIASRPKPPTNDFPFGYGLESLLELWKLKSYHQLHLATNNNISNRYFDQYTVR